jgi:hypothetical protein
MFLSGCEFFNTCSQYLSIHESSTYCTILLWLSLLVFVFRFNHSLCCIVFCVCLTVDLPFTRLMCQILCIYVLFLGIALILKVQIGFQNETQNYFVYSNQFYLIFRHSSLFIYVRTSTLFLFYFITLDQYLNMQDCHTNALFSRISNICSYLIYNTFLHCGPNYFVLLQSTKPIDNG